MSMAGREATFGFKLQDEQRAFVEPDTWFPAWCAEAQKYPDDDPCVYQDVSLQVAPDTVPKLLRWIMPGHGDDQCGLASVTMSWRHTTYTLWDVVVRTATFDFELGRPVDCSLYLKGMYRENIIPSGQVPAANRIAPLVYEGISLRFYDLDLVVEGHDDSPRRMRIRIDNAGTDEKVLPHYAARGSSVHGMMSYSFMPDALVSAAFDEAVASMQTELTRGDKHTWVKLPNIVFTGHERGVPTKEGARVDDLFTEKYEQTISFFAYGPDDDAEGAIMLG